MTETGPLAGTKRQQAKSAHLAFRGQANELTGRLLRRFEERERLNGKQLSKLAYWYVDQSQKPEHLVAVVAPFAVADSMDSVLAFGLAWQADADLVVLAPQELVGPYSSTLLRLTCIRTPVRVFGYDTATLEMNPAIVPSFEEALQVLRVEPDDPRRAVGRPSIERFRLADPLIEWATQHPLLDDRSPNSYLSWQYKASPVLTLIASRKGLKVRAGSKKVVVGKGKATSYEIADERSLATQFDAIVGDVEAAIEQIRSGAGRPDVEHRLQANLVPNPDVENPLSEQLGLSQVRREFPVWRGVAGEKPGLIDFLAIDNDGSLRIIETKANPDDPKIVLQAVDYWLWVNANREKIELGLGSAPDSNSTLSNPIVDFVCAPKVKGGRAIGGYMQAQLDALAHNCPPWRVWLDDDADAVNPKLTGGRLNRMPANPLLVAKPVQPQRRWALAVREGLGTSRRRPEAQFLPKALVEYESLKSRNRTHRFVLQRYSSQALCLNVFAELGTEQMRSVSKDGFHIPLSRFEGLEFEYEDPQDLLNERRDGHEHQTQIDAVVRGEAWNGERFIALIECKFTEGFSPCSGYEDLANDDRENCRTPGLFGSDPGRCYKLRAAPGEGRAYDTYLSGSSVTPPDGTANCGGCFVRDELYQPMRALALAGSLVERGEADLVTYALCAPKAHVAAWRRLEELKGQFPNTPIRTIQGIAVEDVVRYHDDGGAKFNDLYGGLLVPQATVAWDPDNLAGEYLQGRSE
jgi:hypothetical protein